MTRRMSVREQARELMPVVPAGMRTVRFNFDLDDKEPVYSGFTDGGNWNGFPNIWCDASTFFAIVGYAAVMLAKEQTPSDSDNMSGNELLADEDFETVSVGIAFMENVYDLARLAPDARGLYCFADGFTPVLR